MADTKPKLIIFGDPRRKFAAESVERFVEFAEGKAQVLANCFRGSCELDVLKKADFAVVFGGDGTILSAARDLSQANVPVIGVNVGKLGYLAEFSVDELLDQFADIVSGNSLIEKRMIIRCCVMRDKEKMFCSTAINDMVISAGPPFNMVHLKMAVAGQPLAECIGDGVIISTPTGSTAYNLSAGGPILSADLSALVVTPVCPQSLSFRPIVINAAGIVDVELLRANAGTTLTLDGQISHKLQAADVVTLQKDQGAFLVVNNPLRTQWDTLASKLNWADKPKYTN
ncbi:MAG: NAD(+)/NADH kinase [Planctomycetes bacterium]|nr:NAD(+)/NADH kinase [Planctomycetota bacterium]